MHTIKIKTYKYFFLLLIFMLQGVPCYANETEDHYINLAVKSFFSLRQDNINNQLYSPLGVHSCISGYTHTLDKQEDEQLLSDLASYGIAEKNLVYSNDSDNLQFFTTILTKHAISPIIKNKIKQAKIILGEKILTSDKTAEDTLMREEHKQEIQKLLQQKFKNKESLDYEEMWSSDNSKPRLFFKIISALRFEDKWQDGKFTKIGKHIFTSFDNQKLEVEYMKNRVCAINLIDLADKWEIVRLFYKNSYALDIIIPGTDSISSAEDKTKIMTQLISAVNNYSLPLKAINLQMPLFQFKNKHSINNILKEMYPSFNNNDVSLEQECIIKVDEEGTVAEAKTVGFRYLSMPPKPREIIIDKSFYFMISEIDKIKISHFHTNYKIKNIIMVGAVNNPNESN